MDVQTHEEQEIIELISPTLKHLLVALVAQIEDHFPVRVVLAITI